MRKKAEKILIFVFISFIFLFLSRPAFAIEVIYPPVPGAETPQVFMQKIEDGIYESNQAFPLYIKYAYNLLITVSGLVCLGTIIWGGASYLLAFGSATKMAGALKAISAGFLGIAITISSFLILKTLNPQLLAFEIEKPDVPEPVLPEIPDIEEAGHVYVEIPLAGLIDWVRAASVPAKERSEELWYEAAEENPLLLHASLRELNICLKRISERCDCGSIDTENCNCYSLDCPTCTPANCPTDADPCDTTVAGLPLICADLNVASFSANVREAINDISSRTETQIQVVKQKKAEVEVARMALDFANQRLKIGEALLRDSLLPPLNFDSFVSLEEKEIKKLWLYENISTENDSATLYISYKGNEDMVALAEGLLTRYPPIGPPPDPNWTPGPYDGPIPPSPPAPPPDADIDDYAANASIKTGVRQSLILALLSHESGYGRFPGSGHYSYDLCGHPNCSSIGAANCSNFEHIWKQLTGDVGNYYEGYSIYTVPLSAAGEYCVAGECHPHCGGAMGPAQAMSYTWVGFEGQVKSLTGKQAVSPWNFEDAFIFTGLHLKDRGGADSHRCADEADAVWHYVGGHRNHAYNMVELANSIAITIGEEQCRE